MYILGVYTVRTNNNTVYLPCQHFFEGKETKMPSNKPKIVAYTEKEVLEKFKRIAKKNERSVSQEVAYLVKKEINNFEKENGEIKL